MVADHALALLFTDIQGSTRLLDRLGDRYRVLLSEHHRVIREAIGSCRGTEVDTAGDSFFVVFETAEDAVRCAVQAQRELARQQWPEGEVLRVRMGIHSGAVTISDGSYVGMDVHRAARVMSIAHGGQVLLTDEARRSMALPPMVRDLGFHRLKDLPEPEHLFQLLGEGLADGFPELRSLNRSNLPVPPTAIVGRGSETKVALEVLRRQETRLLTLIGPGGVGKTRLAIEIASEAVSLYPDGVWLLSLELIQSDALIASELASILDIREIPGELTLRTVVAGLAERAMLLFIDNAEHLRGVSEVVAEVLAGAPQVKVLCTSREPLMLRTEQRMDVLPLALADAQTLFMERALAMRSELSFDDDDRASVARICARLDGLPLAIELAAARAAVLRPKALEARLIARLSMPAGPRDLPERQRTLRATIDWSYRLLEPDEQDLLCALSPFIGGIRLDMTEAIWGAPSLDHAVSLAGKSLLRRGEDDDGEPRLWLLETIREFAAEQAATRGSHASDIALYAESFFALVSDAAPQLREANQAPWLDRLDSEQPNLRAALDHLAEADPARGLLMAAGLRWFWEVRNHVEEARHRLTEMLARAPDGSRGRAEALFGAGRMALLMGDASASEPLLIESVSIARVQDDKRLLASGLSNLSWTYSMLGEDQRWTEVTTEATAIARAAGDEHALSTALNNHADGLCARGHFQSARPHLEEALVIRRRLGEPRPIALTAANLALIALGAGDEDVAELLIDEGLSHARAIGYKQMIASLLSIAALASLQRRDTATAQARLGEAVDLIEPGLDPEIASEFLAAAAILAAGHDQPLIAATLWGATDTALAQIGRVETPVAATLRAQLFPAIHATNPDGCQAAQTAGARLALDDALTTAMRFLTNAQHHEQTAS